MCVCVGTVESSVCHVLALKAEVLSSIPAPIKVVACCDPSDGIGETGSGTLASPASRSRPSERPCLKKQGEGLKTCLSGLEHWLLLQRTGVQHPHGGFQPSVTVVP